MKPFRQRPESSASGFTILESMITLAIICIAFAASTSVFSIAIKGLRDSKNINEIQAEIEANVVLINDLSRKFTCCSGVCTTTPPTNIGTTSACATDDPNDKRYYFPQLDDPSTTANISPLNTTPSEPIEVDQICATANNIAFMTPLKAAIDALRQPSPATRVSAEIKSYKLLKVAFTEPISGITVRTVYVKPRMANFCS